MEQVNKITFKFIWDENSPKIKRKTVMGDKKKNGRLNTCDFTIMEKALKIAWINRIQNQPPASWKIIPNYILQHHGNLSFLTDCNDETKVLKLDNLPTFYCLILEHWQYYKTLTTKETDIKYEILWNNCNILINKKSVF